MWQLQHAASRRQALRALAGFIAGSPLLQSQIDPTRYNDRIPGFAELATTFDFETIAYARLPRSVYDYPASTTDSGFTKRRNREAFDWVQVVPRRFAGVQKPVTATKLFGTDMAFPFMVSPTAAHSQFHPEGEMATHQGAAAASNTTMIVSNNSSFPIDKVGAAATSPLWFQLYPKKELEDNQRALEAAQQAGCRAVVVTIDQQAIFSEITEHDQHLTGISTPRRTRTQSPSNPYRVGDYRMWYEWSFFDKIRPFVKVPLLAKGILTAEDALLCLEHGLDGVYVSNHGGRSLDYAPSTLEVLPEIVDAVRGRVPVLLDSGIRRGSDILKALALGATAVCVGRVPLWGLASYGPAGVQRVLEILQAELVQAMVDAGRPTLVSLDRSLLRTDFR
jgi:isopentenyl diphosphate isomerase/L-lactate dehydrogenase-like FMN-dependent dehydrogenase